MNIRCQLYVCVIVLSNGVLCFRSGRSYKASPGGHSYELPLSPDLETAANNYFKINYYYSKSQLKKRVQTAEDKISKYEHELESLKQNEILLKSKSSIEAADAQLRSSRQFIEEQAAERDAEREELLGQIEQLKAALREQKHAVSFDNEAKLLEQQLEEAQKQIKVMIEEKTTSDENLTEAKTKIWELRDIVATLEKELATSRQNEAGLAGLAYKNLAIGRTALTNNTLFSPDGLRIMSEMEHVHFAPDISHLVNEDKLNYSDLRLELDTCMERLKREASELLCLTQAKCKHSGLEELVAKYEREIEQLKQDAVTPEMQSLQHQMGLISCVSTFQNKMNGNVETSTENEQNSPSALYLDSVKGVLLLWHEEIMGGGGNIQNLNSVLISSAHEIASCLQSEQSRQELQYVHELVMKAIEQDRLVPALKPLSEKHEEELRLLSQHFDKRYEHIINSDLTTSSLPMQHRNGSLMEYNESWNGDSHNLTHTRDDLKYTPEQFEEKLSEYVQKLTINLENKYIKELEDMNRKHEETLRQIEKFYENKLELEDMNRKHEETLRQIEKFYENKLADEKVNSSFSKIEAADAQLRSSRQFIEEQSDKPFSKVALREQKHAVSFDNEAKLLEQQLEEAQKQIKVMIEEKTTSDENLTEAKTKIWELRDIVATLEKELATSRQNEAGLATKLSEFQELMEKQYQAHAVLVGEFESLSQNANTAGPGEEPSTDPAGLHQIKTQILWLERSLRRRTKELETLYVFDANLSSPSEDDPAGLHQIKTQILWLERSLRRRTKELETLYVFDANLSSPSEDEPSTDPAGLHQIKTQILWLERSLRRRTKELETLYVFDANLSSPSEDISARDEMVNTPDSGRVDSPGLPLEEMTSLYEQFVRHSRAEDATVKCLKDTVLQLTSVRTQLNEALLERDALQGRYNKTLGELSQAKVQLEELRHSLFTKKSDQDEEKHAEIDLLEEKVKSLTKALLIKDDEMKEKERMIEQKDRMMWSLEQELSSKDVTDYRLRDASHMSHTELKPRRIASPVVRFNDTTFNDTHHAQFSLNRTEPHDSDLTGLLEQNKQLKEQLLQKEQIIVEIKADADSLKVILNDLQDKVQEAKRHSDNMTEQENSISEYKLEIENKLATIERYEKEIEQLKQELEDVNKQYKYANKDKDGFKKEIDELNEKIKEIQGQCNQYESKNTQLQTQINSCERKFGKLIEEFAVLNENKTSGTEYVGGMEDFVETLRKELKVYVEKHEVYKRERGDLEGENQSNQQEIVNLKLKESQLKKRVQTAEDKISKYEHELESLKQNEILLKNQLDRLNLTCEVYKTKASDLDKKEELIRKLKENIKLSEQNYVELEKELDDLRKRDKKMFDEIQNKEQMIETLKENQKTTESNVKQECEQCKEFELRDQTSRLSSQLAASFSADQSAAASFDIKSLKDEMFSELAEKLRKELQLSAKLDEKLLSKQKDFASEEQEHIIQTLTEDKRKLRELLLTERARFENEQLQDADLLEKLRQKLETTKESSKKIIQELENEIKSIVQEKGDLLNKIKQLESSLETYANNLDKTTRSLQELQSQFSKQNALLEETQTKLKQETDNLKSAKEEIITLESELMKTKEQIAETNEAMSKRDVQHVFEEQINTLNSQAMKICQLEKLFTEQKCQQEDAISNRNQLEERIQSLNETLMKETKKVLRHLREKEIKLEIERERVVTLREKLLEKSKTLAAELEKTKHLEMTSLYEQFVRHSRAEDATVKCLKDTVLQLTSVRTQLNEALLERDALQGRYNKTLGELSQAKVQLEELRHSLFTKKSDQDEEKHAEIDLLEEKVKSLTKNDVEIDLLEEKVKSLTKALLIKDDEMKEKERMIEQKDRMMWSLEQELSSKDVTDYRLRDASHMSHTELKPRRIASPVVRFNDTTFNDTHHAQFSLNRTEPHDSDLTGLLEQNKELKEQLLQKEQIIVEIKADADSLKVILNDLQDKVQEAKRHSDNMTEQENSISEYKLEIENKLATIERYEKEIEQLKQELEDVNKQYKYANKDKDGFKKEIDELNEKIKEIQGQCNQYESKNTQLQTQINSCERKFGKFIEEFAVLNENKTSGTEYVGGMEDFVETLRKELKVYVEKHEIYKKERGDLEGENQSNQQEIVNLKLKESQLKKRVQTAEDKISKYEHELESLKQNEILLKNQLDRLNLTCEVYKTKASDLDKKEELIRKLKENIKLSEKNYVELEKELDDLRKRDKKMFDEIQNKEQIT
ncbi:nucleoporin nup211-like [Diaphorina citri]|uniref:Nucleoporin nup211-like n=1 Tax=Diaphorina citri TaxID=121845 RepID=A0A3Q0J3R4_DIACI|nr:nucleoporin nup211-like [Diaphorina citri]